MFSQSATATSISRTGVIAASSRGRAAARIVTGALAVVAGLVGTQLIAPVEASAAVAASSGLHQEATGAVKLSGTWTTHTSDKAIGGSYANLNSKGEAQISFKSTGIAWIGRRNAYAGIAAVYLDGVKKGTVDLYSATTKYEQVIYRITGLKNTTHTLKIVRTGTKNAKSNGRNLIVDAFNVLDTVAPVAPAGLTATPERSGARITWKTSPGTDLAGYRVYRNTGSIRTLIGTTTAPQTSFFDIGLATATSHSYTVTAHDTSTNTSTPSAAATVQTAKAAAVETRRYANCPAPTTTVTNRAELLTALAAAHPGTVIALQPGRYAGPFPIKGAHGTADEPIWVCGPRTAVIDTGDYTRSGGIRMDTSSHVIIAGLTVRQSQKGIAVINSDHIVIADTRVDHIGDEAIHLRNSTTDSVVIGNSIEYTGLMTPMYGEGIYIGSSEGNWCAYNNCQTDASNNNTIADNDISHTTADQIEAKEGALDGTIINNTLDGTGMDATHADSLINIQTNGWTMSGNTGHNAPLDGIQVWAGFAGYGQSNHAYDNTFTGTMPGYAVRLAYKELGNIVGCDNKKATESIAIANKPCQL